MSQRNGITMAHGYIFEDPDPYDSQEWYMDENGNVQSRKKEPKMENNNEKTATFNTEPNKEPARRFPWSVFVVGIVTGVALSQYWTRNKPINIYAIPVVK